VAHGFGPLATRLAGLVPSVARVVELGCGVGRGLYELARHAQLVVGVDLQLAALRRARRLLRGQPVTYARRLAGRHYGAATLTAPAPAAAPVALVCGDALDPPLVPGTFDRVAAVNIVDAVPDPARLLAVADGLCAPGGEVVLASPYAWQSGIVAEEHRLGDGDPAAAVRRRFLEGQELEAAHQVLDEGDVEWTLRRDARAATYYRVHWLRTRKAG
jgi:SAM-dependent methyltransferase